MFQRIVRHVLSSFPQVDVPFASNNKLVRFLSLPPTNSNLFTKSGTYTVVPVRHRWHATRPAVLRNFGYEDKMQLRGLLPRVEPNSNPLPRPPYVPKDNWTEKKALFGQNDYIDILGDGSMHPTQISSGVPAWLKGFRGTEYQMLLRKRKFFGVGLARSNPDTYANLQKRLRYLYRVHNFRRKYYHDPRK